VDGPGEIVMTTERMVLRRFTGSDVDVLYELDGDREVMRYLSRERTSREFIQSSLIPNLMQEYHPSSGLGSWAAIARATNEFIG
jgi:RimJ/RimL family protein N-acetyltransferase